MFIKNKLTLNAYSLALICAVLDQASKIFMLDIYGITEKKSVEVTSFFNLVSVWNRGISFGMFQGHSFSNYFFIVSTSVIAFILTRLIKKAKSKAEAYSFAMIVGGALGNLIDRFRIGAVADFFDFHIGEAHWPAFNVADSCVFCGAALLIISTLFQDKKSESSNEKK